MKPSERAEVVADNVHNICRALETARSVEQVQQLLQYASRVYLAGSPDEVGPPEFTSTAAARLSASHESVRKLLDICSATEVEAAFWHTGFAILAETLLTVAAGEWQSLLSAVDARESFEHLFQQAPAAVALSALLRHLASVQLTPIEQPGTVTVAELSAVTAAELLAARFASPGSTGIAQLAAMFLDPATPDQGGKQMEEVASLLVSVPERAASTWVPALQPNNYIPQLVNHLLAALLAADGQPASALVAENSCLHKDVDPPNGNCAAASVVSDEAVTNRGGEASTSTHSGDNQRGVPPPFWRDGARSAFIGCVLSRLARRGYSRQVASTLWAAVRRHPERVCLPPPTTAQLQPTLLAAALGGADPVGTEKLLEALLVEGTAAGLPKSAVLQVLADTLPSCTGLLQSPGVRFLLEDKLLLHSLLPPLALHLLLELLARLQGLTQPAGSISAIAVRLAQAWGSTETVHRLPARRQAYLAAALGLCLQQLGKVGIEGSSGLVGTLLAGVSERLDSPIESVRRQGMRIGNAFARLLDPGKSLFEDHGSMDLLPEELWHSDCTSAAFGIPGWLENAPPATEQMRNGQAPGPVAAAVTSARSGADDQVYRRTNEQLMSLEVLLEKDPEQGATLSDAGTATDSDDSLEPLDLNEDDGKEFAMEGDKPLQLRDLAEMLRKTAEPQTVVKALGLLGPLIEAAPDELANYSAEMARSLLYCGLPEWADAEAEDENKPSVQRLRAMTSLLVEASREGGLALAAEIYSPHLDLHQRLLILDVMAAAATEMSTPPSSARAALKDHLQAPSLPGPAQDPFGGRDDSAAGKTRRWGGLNSLALRRAQQKRTFRNRFPEVAVNWVSALLHECAKERHGVDLLGRDVLLLGRLLITLGVFVQAASPSVETVQIAATTLELVRAPAVHAHPQPYVRRAALIAASEVLSALPPARLAGAVTGGRGDVQDEMLVERLEWLQGWLGETARGDADHQVRMLAVGGQSLQSELMTNALEHIDTPGSTPQSLSSRGPTELLGLAGNRRRKPSFEIKLPDISGVQIH